MSGYKELSKEIVFFTKIEKSISSRRKKIPKSEVDIRILEMWNPPNHWFPLYFFKNRWFSIILLISMYSTVLNWSQKLRKLKFCFPLFWNASKTHVSEGKMFPIDLKWHTRGDLPSPFHEILEIWWNPWYPFGRTVFWLRIIDFLVCSRISRISLQQPFEATVSSQHLCNDVSDAPKCQTMS